MTQAHACCFCGGTLAADGGVVLSVSPARARDEVQGLTAHGHCLAPRLLPSVPLHPDLPDDGFGADVVEAATVLLALPDAPTTTAADRNDALSAALDRLAIAYDSVRSASLTDADFPDPPRADYGAVRARFGAAFPDLGVYNAVTDFSEPTGNAAVTAGDALDDLADIAVDLHEVLDRTKASMEDAVWHFRFGFETHWGTHLRWLQLYLHARRA
jgi:hypothetical protein